MNPMDDIATIRRVALYLGLVALALAAAMSFSFGLSMSWKHAALLGLLTFAGSIVWPYIGHLKVSGMKAKALAFSAAGVLFLAVELFSHVGFTNGQRTADVVTADVQNVAYDTKQESVKRNAKQLEDYKASLAELKAQNAWAATVTADALRAQIPAMDLAIAQETKRGGCGPKCLKLTQEKADVGAKIAIAEKAEDLSKQIALFQGLVNSKETEAVTAEFKVSPVAYQTSFVSQIWTMSLEPGKEAKAGTQIGISFLLALVTTFLAPVLISIAYGPVEFVPGASRKIAAATQNVTDEGARLLREMHALMSRAPVAPVSAPANHTHEKEVVVLKEDDPRAKALYGVMEVFANEARAIPRAA